MGNYIIIYHREHWYWLVNKCLRSQAFWEDLYSSLVFNVLDIQASFTTRHLIMLLSRMCDISTTINQQWSHNNLFKKFNLNAYKECHLLNCTHLFLDHFWYFYRSWQNLENLDISSPKIKEIHSGMNMAWVNVLKKYTKWNIVFGAQVGMSQPQYV